MRGHLVMSKKERERKVEFEGVQEGRMTIKEAAAGPGLQRYPYPLSRLFFPGIAVYVKTVLDNIYP